MTPAELLASVPALAPSIILFLAGCVLLAIGLTAGEERGERRATAFALAAIVASGVAALRATADGAGAARAGGIVFDPLAAFLHLVILLSTAGTLLIAGPFLRRTRSYHAEFPALILFAASGMSLFVSTTDLLLLFLALELLSLPVYVLAGYQRDLPASNEAALKYFVLGAFSSAVFLYGIALVYGATGHADLARLTPLAGTGHLLPAGLLLLLAGFLFKVAAVPFHMWTPDVYEGAPTPITAFMSTAVKAAGFGALLRLVQSAGLTPGAPDLTKALSVLAVLTMTVGNLGALTQANVKRMLAFSSIAHAGYLLVGVAAIAAAPTEASAAPILYYLLAYALTNLAAFGVIVAVGEDPSRPGRERQRVASFAGLSRRHPGLSIAFALSLLSLAGVPPTVGFFGKYLLFQEAVWRGLTPLVVWGVLNSALSLAYYAAPIVGMYMQPERDPIPAARSFPLKALLVILALAILWAGMAPSGLLPGVPDLVRWAETSVAAR